MTSETEPEEAFVWIWLPGETKPVVAGRLARTDGQLAFNYGRSYLARKDAIPIYEPELPLKSGILRPLPGLALPSCIRDAAPDAWGRRVILNRKFGHKGPALETADLDELTYLLESGSDRIGALDFQLSPSRYEPRETTAATLEELLNSATRVEEGKPLNPELDLALFHGSSLGGARPKAMIEDRRQEIHRQILLPNRRRQYRQGRIRRHAARGTGGTSQRRRSRSPEPVEKTSF